MNYESGNSQSGPAVGIDTLRVYLDQMGEAPLLTKEQEVELAMLKDAGMAAEAELSRRQATAEQTGEFFSPRERRRLCRQIEIGLDAKHRFVAANLRLGVDIAKRYQSSGTPLPDLIQEATLGLYRAVELFDHRKGFKFSTYATTWVRQKCARAAVRQTGRRVVDVPLHLISDQSMLNTFINEYRQTNSMEPSAEEIEAVTGISPERLAFIRSYRHAALDHRSIYEPLNSGTDILIADVTSDDESSFEDDAAERATVNRALLLLDSYTEGGDQNLSWHVEVFKLAILNSDITSSGELASIANCLDEIKSSRRGSVNTLDIKVALNRVSGYLREALGVDDTAGIYTLWRRFEVMPVYENYLPKVDEISRMQILRFTRLVAMGATKEELNTKFGYTDGYIRDKLPDAKILQKLDALVHPGRYARKTLTDMNGSEANDSDQSPTDGLIELQDDDWATPQFRQEFKDFVAACDAAASRVVDEPKGRAQPFSVKYEAFKLVMLEQLDDRAAAIQLQFSNPDTLHTLPHRPTMRKMIIEAADKLELQLSMCPKGIGAIAVRNG